MRIIAFMAEGAAIRAIFDEPAALDPQSPPIERLQVRSDNGVEMPALSY